MKKVLRKSSLVAGILALIVVCLGIVLAGDVIVKQGTLTAENVDATETGTFNELTITAPSANYYNFTSMGTESLSIQSQTSGQRCILDLFTKDGDGDVVTIVLWAKGTPDDILTESEYLQIQYYEIPTSIGWLYRSLALGDGLVRPITFQTGASLNFQLYLDTDGDVGIGTSFPQYPLEVIEEGQGISIYAAGDVSADDYQYHSSVYDKSRGKALDFIQDADYYKNPDGTLDHTKFYGYAGKINVTDYSRPVINEVCDEFRCFDVTSYPYQKEENQISVNKELDVLRQAIFELKQENQALKSDIAILKQAVGIE